MSEGTVITDEVTSIRDTIKVRSLWGAWRTWDEQRADKDL